MNTSIPSADDIVTNVIHSLSDNPNESGLSAEELKTAFDTGSSNIKAYLKTLKTALETKFAGIYPVGSIYMSVNDVNPSTLFGGTWERIQDKFLLSAGNTYTAGDTGGSATVTLTENQMPSHRHNIHYRTNVAASGNSGLWVLGGSTYSGKSTSTNDSAGGGEAHNNMPPYLVVYMWKRTG